VRAVTEALVVTSVAGVRHHEAFHRFFSRGTWKPDRFGELVFKAVLATFPETNLRFIIDDTLVHKRGAHVFGIGSHIDPVHSTKRYKILAFGHVWVVFAVLVRVPFSTRSWALPLLFRLYHSKKDALRKGNTYRIKTALAREMLHIAAGWTAGKRITVSMDSAYCCDTVMRSLPPGVVVFGALRGNAALTSLPNPKIRKRKVGRPSVRGRSLPNPRKLVKSRRHAWHKCTATLYGKKSTVRFKEVVAQWYRGTGTRPLRIIVRESDVTGMVRVVFCTDTKVSAAEILEGYNERWAIEVCFRELKQLLGFGDSSARKKLAVERVAPFVGISYSLLVVWFAQGVHRTSVATPPLRPWYPHKRGSSFADVLRAAQRTLAPHHILDLLRKQPLETETLPLKTPRIRLHSARARKTQRDRIKNAA
jgi:hypothetical protein